MKFIHTSDWHLGKFTHNVSRLDDQKAFLFDFFLPLCDAERPDGVLLAGDVFDRSVAPTAAIRLFDDFVHELCERQGIALYTAVGNHDGADRFTLGSGLLRRQGFTVAGRLSEKAEIIRFEKENVVLTLLPYFDPVTVRDRFPHREIRGFEEAFRAVMEEYGIVPEPGAVNLLMTHCFVAGGTAGESESTLYVGGSGEVPAELFEGFGYVALGHLHRPQNIGKNCRYSGSPMPFAFDEEGQVKSVTVLEIENGEIRRRTVPVPGRAMRTVTGSFEEILAAAASDPRRDDYIYANLTDDYVFNPSVRLREVYPNLLGMQYLRSSERSEGDRETLRQTVKRGAVDDLYVFAEFMKQICGEKPTEEDLKIFAEACAEIGRDE